MRPSTSGNRVGLFYELELEQASYRHEDGNILLTGRQRGPRCTSLGGEHAVSDVHLGELQLEGGQGSVDCRYYP